MPKKYINPEILKSRFTNGYDDYFPLWKIEMFIDDAPAIDVKEVKHGEWVYKGNPIYCNKCGYEPRESLYTQYGYSNANYCPNCGAKMDGKVQK